MASIGVIQSLDAIIPIMILKSTHVVEIFDELILQLAPKLKDSLSGAGSFYPFHWNCYIELINI
jgi:hypothetical protein